MKQHFIEGEITYDGTQLRSHWIFERTGTVGNAIAAFTGPADVPLKNMVDLVDVAAKERIYSTSMLHFIVEAFDADLSSMILKQRLLSAIAAEKLKAQHEACRHVVRKGDDLYDGEKKLSVSIATASPVSCLIHFAINIKSDRTPVPTVGLSDYGIDPVEFAGSLMSAFAGEIETVGTARSKVRPVP